MKKVVVSMILAVLVSTCYAQVYKFDFTSDKKVKEGYTKVTPETLFNDEQGYGYDLQPAWDGKVISLSSSPSMFPMAIIK